MPSEKFLELMRRKKLEREAAATSQPVQVTEPKTEPVPESKPTPEPSVNLVKSSEIIPKEEKIKRIGEMREIFKDLQGLPPNKIWDELERSGVVQPIIKEIQTVREPSTPAEKLAYHKLWRQRQELLKAQTNRQEKAKARLESALKTRKRVFCRICNQSVPANNPRYEIVQKVRSKKRNLILIYKCELCGNDCRTYGGSGDDLPNP